MISTTLLDDCGIKFNGYKTVTYQLPAEHIVGAVPYARRRRTTVEAVEVEFEVELDVPTVQHFFPCVTDIVIDVVSAFDRCLKFYCKDITMDEYEEDYDKAITVAIPSYMRENVATTLANCWIDKVYMDTLRICEYSKCNGYTIDDGCEPLFCFANKVK